MSASFGRLARSFGSCVVASLLAVGAVGSRPARANPIRRIERTFTTQVDEPMQAYFHHALEVHSLHVRVPVSMRELKLEHGRLHESAFVDYLRWRWSLNPVRFARYHPHTATLLRLDKRLHITVASLPPLVHPPLPSAGPPAHRITPAPEFLIPPSAPEPATGLIAVVLVMAAWRVRRGRLPRP